MAAARRILISRRDWMQDAAASLAGGVWWPDFPLDNMLDPRPQFVAQAVTNVDWKSPTFDADLGYTRKVGLIYFANLMTTRNGVMRVRAGTDSSFGTTNYDVTTSTWPQDATAFDYDAWSQYSMSGVYQGAEYVQLGMPRFFIPTAVIDCRYIRVEIFDSTAAEAVQIGCFGACEVWAPPLNFKYDWSMTPMDESDIQHVPFGSTYVSGRGMRRRLNLGWGELAETEVLARSLGVALIKGRSEPIVIVPFPDSTASLEKTSLYGLVSQDSVISNPFFTVYAYPLQIDQLI